MIGSQGYACYYNSNEPVLMTPKNQEIGIYYPIFDNPLDAMRFGELFASGTSYFVREVRILHGDPMRYSEQK